MTKRIRKARWPATTACKEIVLDDDDWKHIEQAYGHVLPLDLRGYIHFVTNALNILANAERSAPALEKVKANTIKLRDVIQLFLKDAGRSAWKLGFTSLENLTEALATTIKEFPNEDLQFILLVQSMSNACDLMLHTLESDKGVREGSIWDAWVQSITELVERYELPSAARKDTDKRSSEPDSGFVLLIQQLQTHLPEELRRHTHSRDALAQAIYRARKIDWWPELLPPNIREKFAAELETSEEWTERSEKFKDGLRKNPEWVERRPGSFASAEWLSLMKQMEEGEDEQTVDLDDADDAAR